MPAARFKRIPCEGCHVNAGCKLKLFYSTARGVHRHGGTLCAPHLPAVLLVEEAWDSWRSDQPSKHASGFKMAELNPKLNHACQTTASYCISHLPYVLTIEPPRRVGSLAQTAAGRCLVRAHLTRTELSAEPSPPEATTFFQKAAAEACSF